MDYTEILVIDIETTGFVPSKDFIVEVGLLKLNLETGEVTKLIDTVCKEKGMTREMIEKSWIVKNSSLTVDQVRYAPSFSSLIAGLKELCSLYPITAFNRKFDIGFLNARGIETPIFYPCPMLSLTPIMKIPKKSGVGHKWPSVEEAWEYFFPADQCGEYLEAHRGYDDALDESSIIHELHKLNKEE